MHSETLAGSRGFPGMQLEVWPLARLVHYVRNPRKNDHVVDRMMASIEEFGFKVPILAKSTGEVIDGHLRLKAAEKLGMTEVPVIPCDDWTDAQCKAFRLLVNRSVTWADWDQELLSLEMLDLRNLDYDIDLTGFDTQEIDELLLAQSEDVHEDDVRPPLRIPHRELVIFGCAGSIESCAEMLQARRQWPDYWVSASPV